MLHKLGGSAKRTGYAFQAAPDILTDFAAYSIKNKTIGGGTILAELEKLRNQAPDRNHYVVFKPARGVWVVAELLTQHVGDHGDDELRYGTVERSSRGDVSPTCAAAPPISEHNQKLLDEAKQ